MDLNELLHQHQASVMRASAANDGQARDNHFAKVAEYAERVRQLRTLRQMADAPTAPDKPETIIYASYAGEAAAPVPETPVDAWEEEGGALDPPEVPAGVTSRLIRRYFVGPYVYQDLDLAVAEHMRQLSAAPGDRDA